MSTSDLPTNNLLTNDRHQMNELGFYTLAGAPESPRDLIAEVAAAEALGIGAAFISERFNIKEAATISGAVAAVSERIGIATAATNHNTRHPMVTAAHAMTMHHLTNGRFSLGLGRGIERVFMAYGLGSITTAQMEDFVGLMRKVWAGEAVLGHDGPAGNYPALGMRGIDGVHIPMTLTAFGSNSLKLAGRCFDAVVLHTFFTDETTARVVQTVKRAAEEAGRNPDDVRVWSCLATIGDHIPEPIRLKKTVGRMGTYLQAYGDLMVRTNNWDPNDLKRFREDQFVATFPGSIDHIATTEQLEHVATLIPDHWLAPAATGTPEQCVATVRGQFDLGCDGVILHGANPFELQPIVDEYRKNRSVESFNDLPANPAGRRGS